MGLPAKAGDEIIIVMACHRKNLERDLPIQAAIACFENSAHPACANLLAHIIVTEAAANQSGGRLPSAGFEKRRGGENRGLHEKSIGSGQISGKQLLYMRPKGGVRSAR